MDALALLAELRRQKVALLASGTSLRVRPGPDGLTDEIRAEIRAHKFELIALLETPTPSCERCGRFAFPSPTTCHWCRKSRGAEHAASHTLVLTPSPR